MVSVTGNQQLTTANDKSPSAGPMVTCLGTGISKAGKIGRSLLAAATLATLSLLSSCGANAVYEDHTLLGDAGWNQDSLVTFKMEVPQAKKPYNLYYFVRHTLDYPYSNIYIRDSIFTAGGKLSSTQQQQFYVAHPVTGRPFGSGLAEVRDIMLLGRQNITFDSAGTYELKLQQYMRVSPLPGVLTVGVKLVAVE